MATKASEVVAIKPIKIKKVVVHIQGDTPLIMHQWSEKAKRQMLDAQMGKAKGKAREAKNPVEDFIRSMYWLTPMPQEMTEEGFASAIRSGARFGFPATGFKQAAISAAFRAGWSKDKVSLQGTFFIEADENGMVEIKSDTPIMREDMVRVMKTTDIRYRGEFHHWSADLVISYNVNGQYSLDAILNMLNLGGYTVGVGEWRTEKGGQNGMFHVAT